MGTRVIPLRDHPSPCSTGGELAPPKSRTDQGKSGNHPFPSKPGTHDLSTQWPKRRLIFGISAVITILAMDAVTWIQVGRWKNSETIASHAHSVTSGNCVVYFCRGLPTERQGKIEEAAAGVDSEFHKKKALSPLDKPPYYIAKLGVSLILCLAGLGISKKAQGLDTFGEPIRRLYSVGEVHWMFPVYDASGCMLVHCFV